MTIAFDWDVKHQIKPKHQLKLQQTTFSNVNSSFRNKIRLAIYCESSVCKVIHMKFQVLFGLKSRKTSLNVLSAAVRFSNLRIKTLFF